jgi:hypothetical protein
MTQNLGEHQPDSFRKRDRNSVPELEHRVRTPRWKSIRIRESLQRRAFSDRQVTMASVVLNDNMLTTWTAVNAGFNCLGWPIEHASCVLLVQAGARYKDVTLISRA